MSNFRIRRHCERLIHCFLPEYMNFTKKIADNLSFWKSTHFEVFINHFYQQKKRYGALILYDFYVATGCLYTEDKLILSPKYIRELCQNVL